MARQLYRQVRQHGVRRRSVLRGALAGGAGFAAVAAGCSSGKPANPASGGTAARGAASAQPSAQQPRRGGSVSDSRFSTLTGRTMDPDVETPTVNKMRRLWYQGLLGYNMTTIAVEPEIAQKWEQPDQNTFVFHLQPGVKWHNKPPANGRALVADDVVFALNRARTPKPEFFNASLLDSVDQITAPDQATVRITAKRPDAVLLLKLGSDGLLLLNPEVVSKAQKFATADEVVGTGPFIIKTLEDKVGASSVRNPDYWKPGLPYLDGFEYKYFADTAESYAALQAKQVDLVNVDGDKVKDYLSHQPANAKPDFAKDGVGTLWLMPNLKKPPLDDARVPRALRLLADTQELRDAWGKVWQADAEYGSVFPSVLDQWDLTPDEYAKLIFWQQPKDAAVKQALDLLSAAGFTKDKPVSLEVGIQNNGGNDSPSNLGELIQAQWRKFSQGAVTVTLKLLEGAQSTAERSGRTFTYALFADGGAVDDPDAWLTQIDRTGGSRNYTSFSDAEIDALIDKQGITFDMTQRKALVRSALQLLADRSPTVMPARVFYLNGVSERVRDHTPEASVTYGRQYDHVWVTG